MAALKCPNASCSFLFDPAKVPPGALLACPRCENRFRVADAKAPTGPGSPANGPAGASVIRSAPPPPESTKATLLRWMPGLLIGLVVAMGLGVLAAAVAKYKAERGDVGGADEQLFSSHRIGIRAPAEPWARDRELENKLVVNLGVYSRREPAASIAYAARAYDTRNATKSELESFVSERLLKLCDNLRMEPKSDVTWLGSPAVATEFRGTTSNQTVIGETMAVTIAGTAYFFFAWAREADWTALEAEVSAARQRARLVGVPSGWKETKTLSQSFAGTRANYTVSDAESIWIKPAGRSPADQDPLCDLYLVAELRDKGRRTDVRPRAELLAYVLPGHSDPMKAAVDFVSKRKSRNPELFQEFVTETIREPVGGDEPIAVLPEEPIAVTRIRLSHPKSPDVAKLLVIAAVAFEGKIVAVEAVCPWDERTRWERRLVAIAGSLK